MKRTIRNKCEASGYRLVGRDFYSVIERDGMTVCATCGKPIKVREFNGMKFIPTHSLPDDKQG